MEATYPSAIKNQRRASDARAGSLWQQTAGVATPCIYFFEHYEALNESRASVDLDQ